MIIKSFASDILLIGILLIIKCYAKRKSYMYVGKGLYYSSIEGALQECTDNFPGLQDVETSIFIEAGTYQPEFSLRSSIFGETSTINFIGEGIEKTIVECNNLYRLIAVYMDSEYIHHAWTFKDMTIKGCKKSIETVSATSGTLKFVNVKFTENNYSSFIKLTGTANLFLNNTIFTNNLEGPNIYLKTNGNVDILNSKLLGFPSCINDNPECGNTLTNIFSLDKVTLNIENSTISNSYHTLNDEFDNDNDLKTSVGMNGFKEISIKNSIFENSEGFASGALSISVWNVDEKEELNKVIISNSTFRNNYGIKSGVIRTAGVVILEIENTTFYNNTSVDDGLFYNTGDVTVDGKKYVTTIKCENCHFENPAQTTTENYDEFSGKLATTLGYGDINIINSVVTNFKSGDLYSAENARINTINTTFSNIELNGPLFRLLYQNEIFEFDGCKFMDITNKHEEYGLIYAKKNSGNLKISNSIFSGINSNYAAVILTEINFGSNVEFFNNEFENIYSRNGIIVIRNEDIGGGSANYNGINIDNCKFNNCSSGKSSIISIDYGSFCNIKDSTFTNCGFGYNNYYQNLSGSILYISGDSYANFNNNTINGCYCYESGAAINLSLNSRLNITDSVIKNCKARKNGGVFYFNNWKGTLDVTKTEFNGNTAINNGGIFDILGENVLEEANIKIDNSSFLENKANLGGVVYIGTITSKFDVTKNLKIVNSQFTDNKAKSGENFFVSQTDQAQYIFDSSNFDDKKVDSHPCNLSWSDSELVTHMSDKKTIMSGDTIPNGLTAYILSDTNRVYNIINESNVDSLSSVMFVNATVLDLNGQYSNDAIVMGDRETFCWSGKCPLKSLKVYGKPGDYMLQIYIVSNGGFISMNSKKITAEITIETCDRKMNKDYLKIGYDMCYNPDTVCNHGTCIDLDECVCEEEWTGKYCNERYKYKYSLALRIVFEVICVLSALVSLFLIYGIRANKKESIIRKSNPTFLIITVVGSLINYSTVIFYHGYRTNFLCSIVLWIKYIGFAVLYGSIMIRIMRVWKIISSSKQKFKTSSMSKTTMFSYLFGLVSIYVVILTVCTIIQKITTVEKLSSNKTFDKCTNSKTTILLYGLTIAMLIWGVYLALETSNLPEQFNEAKSIGISTYIYAFAMIITEVTDNITDLNPDLNFLLMISSMLIYTWTSISTIVIPKVYAVYAEWFVIFDILKRNVHGTENMVSVEQSIANDNYMNNMDNNNVGGLSVIGK